MCLHVYMYLCVYIYIYIYMYANPADVERTESEHTLIPVSVKNTPP